MIHPSCCITTEGVKTHVQVSAKQQVVDVVDGWLPHRLRGRTIEGEIEVKRPASIGLHEAVQLSSGRISRAVGNHVVDSLDNSHRFDKLLSCSSVLIELISSFYIVKSFV